MIDWNALIKPEDGEQNPGNSAECRNKTGGVGTENAQCRNTESNDSCGFRDFVPTVPTVPTSFLGDRKENENHAPGEGGASDNFRAAKTHPVNPIAVTLLLTCCNKATVSKEEILEAIWKLQTIPQSEQIKSWAILCQSYGINPHKAIRPFTEHRGTGTSCQGCKHINMELIPSNGRPVYRFVCSKQHHMLEAFYIGERVLIAPESCEDYQTKSGKSL
ncbi:hypothetical protein HS096_05010 [candidate division WWE3 bacterium]|uniref:Uncharacterized protein n=1 Tax=candidate division WWE3 bacterium TaxID=2053526 RepID=A0A928Y722_UNCKA|nr:hypothetical protein [candidate division WWE3 bacterium]